MPRQNKYIIEILFDTQLSRDIFNGHIPYLGSLSFSDKITITTDKIIIEADRSAIIQLDNVFYNHVSSIYNQIIKSLLFYYSTIKEYREIKSLSIRRTRGTKNLDEKIFHPNEFNQVLEASFKLSYSLEKPKLSELFAETSKGKAILTSISYLLKANTASTEGDKFEKLWKAFNPLFALIGNDKKDFEGLRKLRQFIINNPSITKFSSPKVAAIDKNTFRNAIRWRAMLLDNYSTDAQTDNLKNFIIRYSDNRIMEILLDTKYAYRETFLKSKGYFNNVDSHIKNHIAAKTVNNNELLTFLTGKYMYYVRNKTFHGEKVDSSFRLIINKEDKELKFLNKILEAYVFDLINANHLY